MKYGKSMVELIKSRSSWRSYTSQKLEGEIKEKIAAGLDSPAPGPFGNRARFQLAEKQNAEDLDKVKLGTYGFIKGAHSFIVGAVRKGEKNFEDYGYMFEQIILYLTEIGLATCWMGGSFNRGAFARAIQKKEDEVIPAISPVGYPTGERVRRDKLLRWGAGSNSRKSWAELFFSGDFQHPLEPEETGGYASSLEMVRIGPSASNRQPWRVVKEKNRNNFHFFLERTKGYGRMTRMVIKSVDFQRIDMGIAMCHFDLTAKELQLRGEWVINEPGMERGELTEYVVSWIEKG